MSDQLETAEGENLDGEGAGEGTAKPSDDGTQQPGKPAQPAPEEPIGAEELKEFETKPVEKEAKPKPDDTAEKDRAAFQQAVNESLRRVYKAGEGIDDKEERDKARLEAINLEPEHVRGRLEKLVKGQEVFPTQSEKKEGAKTQTQEEIDEMVAKANAKVKDAEEYKTILPELLKAAKIDVKTADAKIKRTALASEAARLERDHGHGKSDALRLAAATLGLLSAEAVDKALKEGIRIGLKSQLPAGRPSTAPKKEPEKASDYTQMSDEEILAHGDKGEKS